MEKGSDSGKIPLICDVVVIGGGPAGSLAATYLAQFGYHVILLEKQVHPRFNVGENLIPDFWKYCDQAGVSREIQDEGFVRKAGGVVNWHGEIHQLSFRDFGYDKPALHVERDRFDYILLNNARNKGVQVFERVTVQNVDFTDEDYPNVNWNYIESTELSKISGKTKCRYVIDASGQNAVLGRQLGVRQIDESFRFMSVWGYFEDSKYLGLDGNMYPSTKVHEIPPTTYVSSLSDTGGWGWSWQIILRESTSVGLILPQNNVQEVKWGKESWQDYFIRRVTQQPILGTMLEPARFINGSMRIVRDYSYRSSKIAGPGYFMIGDAAGFVDPIFSVGVVLGMYSAYAAAWSIDRIFKKPSTRDNVQEIFTSQVVARLELGRTLALPQYTTFASDDAKDVAKFSATQAQALMYAAALMTNREDNFNHMVEDNSVKIKSAEQLRKIVIP